MILREFLPDRRYFLGLLRGWKLASFGAGMLWLYHGAVGNRMLRWENFKVSMALYFICGLLWCYQGSLKELGRNFRSKK